MLLHDFLDYYAGITPEATFSEFEGARLTYREAQARSFRIARGLSALGLGAGARVAFIAKNTADTLPFYLAAARCGVVTVPINFRLAPAEWAYIIADAGAEIVIAGEECTAGLDSVLNARSPPRERLVLGRESHHWRSFDAWLHAYAEEPVADASVSETSILYQMYTSGTTGRPKGVELTHAAVLANAFQLELAIPYRLARGDRYLIVCPLYHAAAAISVVMTLRAGGALVIHRNFEPAAVLAALAEEVTAATLVPAMIQRCIEEAERSGRRTFEKLVHILYGASPIAEETLRRAMALFDCKFTQAFGMTETTAAATALTAEDHDLALSGRQGLLRSCGRALIATGISIQTPSGAAAATGDTGEIVVDGPQLMTGYWRQPEATHAVLAAGAMRTGDAGYRDADGYVYIQDRLKDMILSGGENIYSAEVENQLLANPKVADAAVIGIPDERYGEAVMAFVVLRHGAEASEDDIIAACRAGLAGFKLPRRIRFVGEIPRNPSGKILKSLLRAEFWPTSGRQVA